MQPELNRINLKLTAIKERLSGHIKRDLKIAGSTLAVGLVSGAASFELGAIISAFGGIPFLKDLATSWLEKRNAAEQVRGENLFFLWRLQEEAGRHKNTDK